MGLKNINTSACSAQMAGCSATCLDQGSSPTSLTAANGKLYFFAQDNTSLELYESDGTATGTVKISSIGNNYTAPGQLTFYNGYLYFVATSTLYGQELFKFNPTNRSYQIFDLYLGSKGSAPAELKVCNGLLVFSAVIKTSEAELGRELVCHNGTAFVYKDLRPGAVGSNPSMLSPVDNVLYFAANGSLDGTEKGIEPWQDALTWTSQPTRVADVCPSGCSSSPRNFSKVGSELYFTAFETSTGIELYKYSPPTGALAMVDLYTGSTSSSPEYLLELDGKVFFSADIHTASHPGKGRELASYSGTALGVKDLVPGPGSSNPSHLFKKGSTLYFVANGVYNGTIAGHELWRRDANNAATVLVRDLQAGPGSSLPSHFVVLNDTLFFAAYSNQQWEVWKTSGNTLRYADDVNGAQPGSGVYEAQKLTVAGNALYFVGNNGIRGKELWKYTSPVPVGTATRSDGADTLDPVTATQVPLVVHAAPNPCTSVVQLSGLARGETVHVAVYTLLGHQLEATTLPVKEQSWDWSLDTQAYPPGTYLVRAISGKEQGYARVTK